MRVFEEEKNRQLRTATITKASVEQSNPIPDNATWMENISNWFINKSVVAGAVENNRWSSFSGSTLTATSQPALDVHGDDYSSTRRSASFSGISSPLEVQAHMMSSSFLTNFWPASIPRKEEKDVVAIVDSPSSSRSGSINILEKKIPTNNLHPIPTTVAEESSEKAARKKDKIAARLAALREKQKK
jgi:hypothetical protein